MLAESASHLRKVISLEKWIISFDIEVVIISKV